MDIIGMDTSDLYIRTIDWDMMDKSKFYPLSMLSSFTVRCFLYPFTVVKTRLQIQRQSAVYAGTFDAYRKILNEEGMPGFYRGFWISAFQLVSGVFYISTYETVRQVLQNHQITDNRVRALIGGGCASIVGQTIIVPVDVVSQHVMVLGQKDGNKTSVVNPLNLKYEGRTRVQIALDICNTLYREEGLRGFYRGYVASLCTYVPNSALWWSFYHFYQDQLCAVLPSWVSYLLIQSISGTLGGFTTTILTNPLDIIRARVQVQRLDSIPKTMSILWEEERMKIFTKGLSARLVQSVFFSFAIILGYETIKRMSVSEEYKDRIRW